MLDVRRILTRWQVGNLIFMSNQVKLLKMILPITFKRKIYMLILTIFLKIKLGNMPL